MTIELQGLINSGEWAWGVIDVLRDLKIDK